MHFYIKKDKKGTPVTTGINNDCLIYMRQYGGENTRFDNGAFVISTSERIKPNLWDDNKSYPKQSQTSIIASIEQLKSDALDNMATNKRNKVVTTTHLLREQLNPKPVLVVAKDEEMILTLWDERVKTKAKTARTLMYRDPEIAFRDAFHRWLVYEEQLWVADMLNSKLTSIEKERHHIGLYPKEFTMEMFDAFMRYLREVELKSHNTVQILACYFKSLCVWISETRDVKFGFNYDKIDASQTSSKKGKIALTLNQVMLLASLKVSKKLEYPKDMFLLQIYVGCRVSDLFRVADNVDSDGILNMEMTKRTKDKGKRIIQKLVKPALDILRKYNFVTPKLNHMRFNRTIREIVKMFDSTTKVEVRDDITGVFERKFLYEVYSSHDNIRTCVRIADQTGMPLSSIARNVGKTVTTLENRYRSTEEKVAHADWGRFEERLLSAKLGKSVKQKVK